MSMCLLISINRFAVKIYLIFRFGRSAALLHIVDEISHASPDTPIAPQVILRQARVMKDTGDLHTALRILDAVVSGGTHKCCYLYSM